MQADYDPPFLFRSAHLSTILPNRLRKVEGVKYSPLTIETSDSDFIDLDISRVGSKICVLLLHGLEGSSHSTYILGMVKRINEHGLDAVAMNHRSCSGRQNDLPSSYHSGKSDDVLFVINKLNKTYQAIHLVGFSLGGNIALKLAGELKVSFNTRLKSVSAISVPCDLAACAAQMNKASNKIYLQRFLNQLKTKITGKAKKFPFAKIDLEKVLAASTFEEFDDAYTAPFHGFKSAMDYYEKSSSKKFISEIRIPTLIINAQNDPFLPENCFVDVVEENPSIQLLTPKYGGHVGFAADFRMRKPFWHERKVVDFIMSIRYVQADS
ncbi:MAG: alpha/beta fold hydrolase [Flavobacteriales bacterium]